MKSPAPARAFVFCDAEDFLGHARMFGQGEIISYIDMCRAEGVSLQRGMNFRLRGEHSVVLMSIRRGAPYADRVEEDGKILIYEGHDTPRRRGTPDPKTVDQPVWNPGVAGRCSLSAPADCGCWIPDSEKLPSGGASRASSVPRPLIRERCIEKSAAPGLCRARILPQCYWTPKRQRARSGRASRSGS